MFFIVFENSFHSFIISNQIKTTLNTEATDIVQYASFVPEKSNEIQEFKK